MRVILITTVILMFSFILTACTKEKTELELTDEFHKNESSFILMSQTACSILNETNTSAFNYDVDSYGSRNSLFNSLGTDSKPDYYLTLDKIDDYGESVISKIETLDALLSKLKFETVAVRYYSDQCRLFSPVWGWGMNGEGQTMEFVYQPEKTYDYDPSIHISSVRDLKSEIKFTIPLSSGWFISYTNTP